MRSILIDSEKKLVSEVEIGADHLAEFYRLLRCDMVEIVRQTSSLTLWIDEEGRLKEVKNGFYFDGLPYAGFGLMTGGPDAGGNTKPLNSKTTAKKIASRVSFMTEEEAGNFSL